MIWQVKWVPRNYSMRCSKVADEETASRCGRQLCICQMWSRGQRI